MLAAQSDKLDRANERKSKSERTCELRVNTLHPARRPLEGMVHFLKLYAVVIPYPTKALVVDP